MTEPCGIVTVLTDFGLQDPYAGVMTGAILRHDPALRVVPLTHGISAQSIAQASLWLSLSYEYFPKGTVHLAVVDPGVGTDRAIVAGRANGHFFVAPDNGLLPDELTRGPDSQFRCIDSARLGLNPRGHTFNGRDLFAPVAAMLAAATHTLEHLGSSAVAQPCVLPDPIALGPHGWRGEVIAIDHFGNGLTNLMGSVCRPTRAHHGAQWIPVGRTYSDVAVGMPLAIVNSWGVVEIAVRNGHAARTLPMAVGDAVFVDGQGAPPDGRGLPQIPNAPPSGCTP